MKVTFLFGGKFPGFGAAVNRVINYKAGLEAQGAQVEVLSNTLNSASRYAIYFNRWMAPFEAFLRALKLRGKSDILFLYGYKWLVIMMVRFGLLFSRTKLVMEVNEKPFSMYVSRISEIKILKAFNKFMTEKIVYPMLDGFVVISDNLENYVNRLKSKKAKVVKIPIIVNISDYKEKSTAEIDTKMPFMLHSGLVNNRKDGIVNVIKGFALVKARHNDDFHFYFTTKAGPAVDVGAVKKVIKNNNLEESVTFLGHLPKDELKAYQEKTSLIFINKPENEQNLHNFPTKLGEFLALGTPVIATRTGEMGKFLKDKENSVLMNQGNPEEVAFRIEYVLDNPEEMKKISENAKQLAKEEFCHIKLTEVLYKYFQDVVKK